MKLPTTKKKKKVMAMDAAEKKRLDEALAVKVCVNCSSSKNTKTRHGKAVPAYSTRRKSRVPKQIPVLQTSWNSTNWEDIGAASLASSQSSIYQVLDADNGNHPTLTKRKPLHELLKEDEEAFEASLRALCLGVKKKTNLASSMVSNLSIPEDCEV